MYTSWNHIKDICALSIKPEINILSSCSSTELPAASSLLKCLIECTSMPIILYNAGLSWHYYYYNSGCMPCLCLHCKQRAHTKSNAHIQIQVTPIKQIMLETLICNFPAVQSPLGFFFILLLALKDICHFLRLICWIAQIIFSLMVYFASA